jgi:hypothetical protein
MQSLFSFIPQSALVGGSVSLLVVLLLVATQS